MTSPTEWIARADAVLAAGGLTSRERDFVLGVRNRKAWSIAKRRRREYLLSPEACGWFREIEGRVQQRKTG
jgi:hypothetical protein